MIILSHKKPRFHSLFGRYRKDHRFLLPCGFQKLIPNSSAVLELQAMLRYLSQPHATTCISSYPEGRYKKLFFKISQNSQKNSCSVFYYSCNFNKKKTMVQVVSCEFCKILNNTFFTEQLRRLLLDLYSHEPILTQAVMV